MDFVEITIKGETYKLRLTTRSLMTLERTLGYNPIQIFMDVEDNKIPKTTDMIIVLQAMLQPLNHGMNTDKVVDLFDDYLADGHSMFELVPVFLEVFQQAGFLATNSEEAEIKN